jgi:arylsulfatase A-like enzyme
MVGKQGHPLTRGVADLVCMIRHPDGDAKGSQCDALFYNHDFAATLLDLAGMDFGLDADIEGRSIWSAVSDNSFVLRDHVVLAWGANIAVINDEWWYTANIFGEGEFLYQVKDDPGHEHNLAKDKPEVCKELLKLVIDAAGGEVSSEFREWSTRGNSQLFTFGSGEPYCTVTSLAKSASTKPGGQHSSQGY